MPSLLDIKARIKAVENIKKITRAMQLVAAAKFQRSQDRARSARPYSRELDTVLGALAGSSGGDSGDTLFELKLLAEQRPIRVDRLKFFEHTEMERPGLVLVTADRGLCGAFNTRLIRAANEFMKEHPQSHLITIGRKGRAFFKTRKIDSLYHKEGMSDKLVLDEIKEVAHELTKLFVAGEVDSLFLIYAQFKSAMVNTVTTEQFLPIPPIEGEGEEVNYILEPDEQAVYATLIPLYVTTKMFATMADSFASEYGSRMTAMQMATKNAEEMLDDLVILRNRMRQATITKELAEIVGGAESMG